MPYYPTNIQISPISSNTNTIVPTNSTTTQLTLKQGSLVPANVTWSTVTNCIDSGNGTLTKNAGGNAFNGGGVSSQNLASGKNGYVQFAAPDTTSQIIAGLQLNSLKGNFAPAAATYAIYLGAATGVYQIVDGTGSYFTGGSYITGDVFKIANNNNVITYYKNGTLIRTSSNTPTSFPLWGQATIFNQGSSITMTIVTDTSSSQTVDMFDVSDSNGNVLAAIDNQGQIHASSGFVVMRKAVSASYSALSTDYYIGYTSTASAYTLTLPAISSCPSGKEMIIKDESGAAATNNITVKGNASENIDGSNTKTISTNYGSVRLIACGTYWSIA